MPKPQFHHEHPHLIAQRDACLNLARQLLDPSARKVKVTKRRRRSGTGEQMYSARVEGAEARVLLGDAHFRDSEEEAVRVLRTMISEAWFEAQGRNFV